MLTIDRIILSMGCAKKNERPRMTHRVDKRFDLEKSILSLGIALFLANVFFDFVYCKDKWNYHMPYNYEPGYQFIKFKEKLNNVLEIGYLTNKDLSPGKNDGIYLQAQYFLAPTLLKLNEANHTFNILDYSNQIFVFYMIKTLKADVLVDNPYAQVLIRKKEP